jgi:uncharacterized protein YutE (UPF0331/DUF86 family)
MIDKILIEKKLRKIEQYLKEIGQIEIKSLAEFKENVVLKRFIERDIELSIEQMVDICKHIVSSLDLNTPETYFECFDIISGEGFISGENLEVFKSMVKFINLLIHGYDKVDDSITYGIYRNHLNDFRLYIDEIRNHLKMS